MSLTQWLTRSAPIVSCRPAHEGDLELGADPIGARDEHRLPVAVRVEAEQPAERSNLRQHARRRGRPCQRLDATDRLIPRVDVDA